MSEKKITLKKLALIAEVSYTTASLILNGKNVRVSKEKKERVLRLAKEYNYRPNRIAQCLVTKRTNTIGLIIPDISNSFFSESSKYIEKSLAEKGYNVILCNTNDNAEEQRKYIEILESREVDAIIICLAQESLRNNRYIEDLSSISVPCIAFDRWGLDMPCPTIAVDNIYGAELAVRHLIENKHSSIGCITGKLNGMSATKRLEGYINMLRINNLSIDKDLILEGDYTFESGYNLGRKLIGFGVSAIFACNDLMAYGVLKAAQELGKKIPEDLSIVGFDDLFVSKMINVPLTTIKQPIEELAYKLTDIVFKKLSCDKTEDFYFIKPSFIRRQSS